MIYAITVLNITGLGVANFVFQLMTAHDWATAIERTVFQAIACFVMSFSVSNFMR